MAHFKPKLLEKLVSVWNTHLRQHSSQYKDFVKKYSAALRASFCTEKCCL